MTFRKAERKRAKARIGISGPSGSGKTYSSILLAQGFGGKIAMVDTEHGSGELYSHLTDYDVATLSPPFDPQRFIDAIKDAEKGGYSTLIFDTLSHPWFGQGGLLEQHDTISRNPKENTYTAWREPTKKHYSLIEAIHQSTIHIISTFRSKQDYLITTNQKGQMVPQKVGLAPIQRDGIEYEYTVFFDLTVEHFATASKDRTSQFTARDPFLITLETGREILEWLNSGAEPVQQAAEPLELTSPGVVEITLQRIAAIGNIFEFNAWLKKHEAEIEALGAEEKKAIYEALDKRKIQLKEGESTPEPTLHDKKIDIADMLMQMADGDKDGAADLLKKYLRKAGHKNLPTGSVSLAALKAELVHSVHPYILEDYKQGGSDA